MNMLSLPYIHANIGVREGARSIFPLSIALSLSPRASTLLAKYLINSQLSSVVNRTVGIEKKSTFTVHTARTHSEHQYVHKRHRCLWKKALARAHSSIIYYHIYIKSTVSCVCMIGVKYLCQCVHVHMYITNWCDCSITIVNFNIGPMSRMHTHKHTFVHMIEWMEWEWIQLNVQEYEEREWKKAKQRE